MKWSKEAARWAISQLDACQGDFATASYETQLTLTSLGHYRHRVAEQALAWFRSIRIANDPVKAAERVAKVRAIANAVGGAS